MIQTRRRTGILIVVAALGAAGMFLGPDGWYGIDVGPVGAALLYGALVLFVIHLSRHGAGVFPVDSAPAERHAWMNLVFIALIALHFINFLLVLPTLGAIADELSNPASRHFSHNLVLLLILWGVVSGVLRAKNSEPEVDERDLRIQHFAGRLADGLLTALILALVILLAALPDQSRNWMRPLIVGNALIGLLIAWAFARTMFIVVRYWRERA